MKRFTTQKAYLELRRQLNRFIVGAPYRCNDRRQYAAPADSIYLCLFAGVIFMLILSFFIFATGAIAAGPSPVNLRTAGSFAILTETGITTTGTTTVVGDMGVSPIAATAMKIGGHP